MKTLVKICGITCLADALAAVEAGADALGFMFYEPSPRHISPAAARAIIAQLPAAVARTGVFVNPPPELVRQALDCGINSLQFHGDESPEFCRQFALAGPGPAPGFGFRRIKAFRVRDESSLSACPPYAGLLWLLDSYVPGQRGGTGEKFNWELAAHLRQINPDIILAGGLHAGNVAQAVRQTRPLAVDVSSGVESAPGKKDAAKIRDFIAAAKAVEVE